MTEILHGKHITETTYVNGVPHLAEFIEERFPVDNEADELKQFIRMQRDAKASPFFTYTRETRKGKRYIIKRIRIDGVQNT